MKKHLLLGIAAVALLAGCSDDSSYESYASEDMAMAEAAPPPTTEFGFQEAREEGVLDMFSGDEEQVVERVTTVDIEEPAPSSENEIPVSIPQIAYTYSYGFRIGGDQMNALQARHVSMCEALGPQGCRVIEMRSSGGEGDYANGYLQLAVAAEQARAFGTQLTETTTSEGGEQTSASITGEDLSKQIVDTEARLRARILLRDRLMDVLRNRQGTVAELVEAERGVAQVNEEIDQAQSWLAEMRGRVQFSQVSIQYSSGAPSGGGFMEPVRNAWGSLGSILGVMLAALIVLVTVFGPIGLLVWGAIRLRRRFRKPVAEAPEAETPEGAVAEA